MARIPGSVVFAFVLADLASLYAFWRWLASTREGPVAFAAVAGYVVLAFFLGLWAMRFGGSYSLRRAFDAVRRSEEPTRDVLNATLALTAGLLFMFPGLLSDAVGVVLLFPPTRAIVRRAIFRARPAGAAAGAVGRVPPGAGPAPGPVERDAGRTVDFRDYEIK